MVTVEWNSLPVLSQHHDFYTAVLSILDHARAMEALYDKPVDFNIRPRVTALLNRAASRNRVYYPHDLQVFLCASSSIPVDIAYKSRDVADERTAELAAYQTSWSVWNGQPCLSQKWYELWGAMQSWKSLGPAKKGISLRYSRYWLTFNAAKDWLCIYDICQDALYCDPQDSKIELSFSLSAASFSGTDYLDIIPLILIFATDTRFQDLTRPPPSHYDLSDGTYPDHARLVNLMSQFALTLEETPAQTMEIRAIDYRRVATERRREYNSSIDEIASTAAQSIVERWPQRRCNLPHQWFDTQGCRECVNAYLLSISRNIDLRDHIHCLQAIIDCYKITIPPDTPYVFSPRFGVKSPKAVSPSLREVLMSRTTFAQLLIYEQFDFAIPSTVTIGAESKPPSSREDSLSCLIQEFQQSRESLLQLYGEDLSKSYSDLLEKAAHFPVHRGVPPQEALRHYRDVCSKQKGALFSELSEALAPSQRLENVVSVSGLWPRITPRSILRELSRNRIHTLANQWKLAITRYAVAFLKYQQSQRLLELSSKGRDEELLQEAKTSCEEIVAACSPDWLLIQVSSFSRKTRKH